MLHSNLETYFPFTNRLSIRFHRNKFRGICRNRNRLPRYDPGILFKKILRPALPKTRSESAICSTVVVKDIRRTENEYRARLFSYFEVFSSVPNPNSDAVTSR